MRPLSPGLWSLDSDDSNITKIKAASITMNMDVLYEVLGFIKHYQWKEQKEVLSSLRLTCTEVSDAVRPSLFHSVRWPHARLSKVDPGLEAPLSFFPDSVWEFIHHFHFDWPQEWPDVFQNPAHNGNPDMFKLLDNALPRLINLSTFSFTLPFEPPFPTIGVLLQNSRTKHLRIVDTPIWGRPSFKPPTNIERLTLVPVGEAMRMGEGPFDVKHHEMQYFSRPYRREFRTKPAWMGGEAYLATFRAFPDLRYLQLSMQHVRDLRTLVKGLDQGWPYLETLVITGALGAVKKVGTMVDVVHKMPQLRDLRILLSNKFGQQFEMSDEEIVVNSYKESPKVFAQLSTLALSNTYETEIFLRHASSVERLSISGISRHPQIPFGMTGTDMHKVLKDLEIGGGNTSLKKVRLMTEDDLTVRFFRELGRICPNLEFVEVERCGYKEGEVGFEWTDYGEAFSAYRHLQELRIGIPFADCDEDCPSHSDVKECIRSDRQDLATYIASSVPTLCFIGFEYRTRTGKYRKEDRWLDYEIIRHGDDIRLTELAPTWYELPEVWERSLLHD